MNRVIAVIFVSAGLAIPLLAARSSVARSLRTIQLVGIGDSVGDPANCAPCKSFVNLYAADAARVLHSQVRVTNLAQTTRLDSGRLLGLVNTDARFKKDLAQASIVTVTIGGNDISTCGGPSTNACYIAGTARVSRNLPKIRNAVEKLRAGQPTAIRVTDYDNFAIGYPGAPPGKAFQVFYAAKTAQLNAAICKAAQSAHVRCVDVLHRFNGSAGNQAATKFLASDHIHPNAAGQKLYAAALDASGFAPLH